jgi:hypothetical protein
MEKQLTIRGVPGEVAAKLERISRERGRSVNATVLDILEEAVGESARRRRLARYTTWTAADAAEVEATVASQRTIDESLWK